MNKIDYNTDFAVFIITHERVNNQKTYAMLRRMNCSANIYFVIDDDDKEISEYRKKYGDKVLVFSKKIIEKTFDPMINKKMYCSAVYARNATFEFAKKMGIQYFAVFDDDIQNIQFRVIENNKLVKYKIYNIDKLFLSLLFCLEKSNNLYCIGPAYAEAFIGGIKNNLYLQGYTTNITQVMMFKTDRISHFRGLSSEDVIMCVDAANIGNAAITITMIQTISPKRSSNNGGMSSFYAQSDEYAREFYTMLAYPSIIRYIVKKGKIQKRCKRETKCPYIISDRYRRTSNYDNR